MLVAKQTGLSDTVDLGGCLRRSETGNKIGARSYVSVDCTQGVGTKSNMDVAAGFGIVNPSVADDV